jgi:hypothetical protein
MKSKMKYSDPEIVKIRLDNTIALQLASDADPLGEPDWVLTAHASYVQNHSQSSLNSILL